MVASFKPLCKHKLGNAFYLYKNDNRRGLELYGNPITWDISHIEDLSYLFGDREIPSSIDFTDIDISSWNTSNVKNMEGLFKNNSVNGIEFIENWDVSNVEDMNSMFAGSYIHNSEKLNLNKWNTSKVKDMSYMFSSVNRTFGLRHCFFNGDINDWNISNVEDMSFMFNHTGSFNKIPDKWDISNVKKADGIFCGLCHNRENREIFAEKNILNFIKYFPRHVLFNEPEPIDSQLKRFYNYYNHFKLGKNDEEWSIEQLQNLKDTLTTGCLKDIDVAIRRISTSEKYETFEGDMFGSDGDY